MPPPSAASTSADPTRCPQNDDAPRAFSIRLRDCVYRFQSKKMARNTSCCRFRHALCAKRAALFVYVENRNSWVAILSRPQQLAHTRYVGPRVCGFCQCRRGRPEAVNYEEFFASAARRRWADRHYGMRGRFRDLGQQSGREPRRLDRDDHSHQLDRCRGQQRSCHAELDDAGVASQTHDQRRRCRRISHDDRHEAPCEHCEHSRSRSRQRRGHEP